MRTKATILVSGMVAAAPWQGGATWAVLQYVLGLSQLGHEVYLIEPISSKAVRPAGSALAASENAAYFTRVAADFALSGRSALLVAGTRETVGLSYEQLRQVAGRSDVFLNISGLLVDESLTESIPVRVYLDIDPAFTQLWSAVQGIDMRFSGHTHFMTIGRAIGQPNCSVPTCGLPWQTTFQPIVLNRWPVATKVTHDALTTVGNWRGYGSIEHQGVMYGQKAHSLRRFYPLPGLTEAEFILALAIHPQEINDLAALKSNGWHLVDPSRVADTPASFQQFVQGSLAEFGIAKSGYVASRCGWFSDRSVCYLASGRPVLAQDTGFARYLPTGEGLWSFSDQDEALRAIQDMRTNYSKNSRTARAIAEEFFDSAKVLNKFLEVVGAH